ncbi:SsrA-binding protein SmpB [Alkalicella caledoniensis]|uniref:SsrA-binding protein n=1 Tax=Alkalicella caledoniensis TaxID=2731377 RepID=A0A7G9W6R4_ALKCA|nr:SsrA-binding protein SmpB [Alkalicella caledoniensis]QNO14376.1 SsrA-binding protein SmpB [Alkalicella caledoniensis]
MKIITDNRKARHEYFIKETYEAGLALKGTEVKSIRNGRVNLKESFCRVENGEIFVYQMHISEYEQGNRNNHDPVRPRKLLLHKSEINKLFGITREKGLSLIPLKLYFSKGRVKMELALAQGKKLHDKRATIAEKTAKREMEKAFRERQKM